MPAKLTRLVVILMTLSLPFVLHAAANTGGAGFSAVATGAANTGNITGTVKDPSGAVVQGARVALTPGGTTTSTDGQGSFSLSGITAGTYTVTISYVGFGDFVATLEVCSRQDFAIERNPCSKRKLPIG